jgi:hypothetical protein
LYWLVGLRVMAHGMTESSLRENGASPAATKADHEDLGMTEVVEVVEPEAVPMRLRIVAPHRH